MGTLTGCGLIPTMGALHEGHFALVRRCVADGLLPVVTVFVNPTQFAPHEDFSRYPRTLDADARGCEAAGARVLCAPPTEVIYPRGIAAAQEEAARLVLPPAARRPRLEDACRPTHFAGVCQVVARLFELCRPARAYFGEKDFQQLRVIAQMAAAAAPHAPEIVPCPTVRDGDGLAMSSRNRFLAPEERARALSLSRALALAQEALRTSRGGAARGAAELAMHGQLAAHAVDVEYAVIRDANTLEAPSSEDAPLRALIAGRVGSVRLIDNAAV